METSKLDEDKLDFVIFCIEALAERLGVDGKTAYDFLNDNDMIGNYIVRCHNVLHTQGEHWIVDDLIATMHRSGVDFAYVGKARTL
jgi:hypothetical protein